MNRKASTFLATLAGLGTLVAGCKSLTREEQRDHAYNRAGDIANVVSGVAPVGTADIANVTTQMAADYTFANVREAAQLYTALDDVTRDGVDERKRQLAQYVQRGLRLAEGDLYLHLNCVRGEDEHSELVGIIVRAPERHAGNRTLDQLAELLAPLNGGTADPNALASATDVMRLVANAQTSYRHFPRGTVRGLDQANELGYTQLGNADSVGRMLAHFGNLSYVNANGERAGHDFTLEAHAALAAGTDGARYNVHGPVLSGQLVIKEVPRGYRSE